MKHKGLWMVLAVVAIAVVGYFGFYYPPESATEMAGTLGGVEKAERHRGDVTGEEDIVIPKDELNDLLLSAEWQNLRRNEEFMEALESGAFQQFLALNKALTSLTSYSLMCQGIVFHAINASGIAPDELKQVDTEKLFGQSDLQGFGRETHLIPIKSVFNSLAENLEQSWRSQNPQQAMPNEWNDELNKVIMSQGLQLKLAQDFMKGVHAVDWKVILSQDAQADNKLFNTEFSEIIFQAHDLAGLLAVMSEESLPAWSQFLCATQYNAYHNLEQFKGVLHWKGLDVESFKGADAQQTLWSMDQLEKYHAFVYKSCMVSQDFQKVFFSQDMQKWFSQDFQKVKFSQDMQKWFSQDFQKLGARAGDSQEMMGSYWSQDFQKVFFSQELQNALLSQEFNALLASPNFGALIMSAEFNSIFAASDMQQYSGGTF